MSNRTTITLADTVFAELEDWSIQQSRPTAGLAAFLVELSLRDAKEKRDYNPSKKERYSLENFGSCAQGKRVSFHPALRL